MLRRRPFRRSKTTGGWPHAASLRRPVGISSGGAKRISRSFRSTSRTCTSRHSRQTGDAPTIESWLRSGTRTVLLSDRCRFRRATSYTNFERMSSPAISRRCHGSYLPSGSPTIRATRGTAPSTFPRCWIFLPRIQRYGRRRYSSSATTRTTAISITFPRLFLRGRTARTPERFPRVSTRRASM